MRSADTDHGNLDLPRLSVTRQVPLWGILCVIGGLGVQAVALYYGQQSMAAELGRLTATLAEVKRDQRELTVELRRSDAKLIELTHQQAGLEQRVRLLEAQPRR